MPSPNVAIDLRPARRAATHEVAARLAQDDELRLVRFAQAQIVDQRQHARLDVVRIDRLLDELIELGVFLQDRPPLGPGVEIERAGAHEQVLDIVGRNPHLRPDRSKQPPDTARRGICRSTCARDSALRL